MDDWEEHETCKSEDEVHQLLDSGRYLSSHSGNIAKQKDGTYKLNWESGYEAGVDTFKTFDDFAKDQEKWYGAEWWENWRYYKEEVA